MKTAAPLVFGKLGISLMTTLVARRLPKARSVPHKLIRSALRFGLTRLLLSLSLLPQLTDANTNILVLQSHDSPPYQAMFNGFQSELNRHGLAVQYDSLTLRDDPAAVIANSLKTEKPNLIFTLGTPATLAALSMEQQIPVVEGLVLGIENRSPNATGISLDFPATIQWLWLRRLLPDAKRIAIIYDPQHGDELFQSLVRTAQAENIELIAAPVTRQEELPTLLQQLPSQLDALWAMNNVAAFNATTVRELLLYSFRNRTPLIGLSEQWVKAGAIYALDWDYTDLGSQAAELVWAILANGKTPGQLPIQSPRKVRPVFNSKTAEHMKLNFPQRWLPEMTEVTQ